MPSFSIVTFDDMTVVYSCAVLLFVARSISSSHESLTELLELSDCYILGQLAFYDDLYNIGQLFSWAFLLQSLSFS